MDINKIRADQAEDIEFEIHHKRLKAKNAMIKAVIVHENDEIQTIIKKLKNEKINHVIVLDKNDNFIGEISIEKLIKLIAHTSLTEPLVEILDVGYHRGINFTTAKDYVIIHNNIVKENDTIIEVLKLIDKKGFNYIPVADEKGKIKGLITPSSLLDLLSNN